MSDSLGNHKRPPDAGDVMKRLIIFSRLVLKTIASPPPAYLAELMKKWPESERAEFVNSWRKLAGAEIARLRKSGLWEEMDDSERAFLEAPPAIEMTQALLDAMWRSESAMCLLWALGCLVELPPYDQEATAEVMKALPREPLELLVKNAKLRSPELIAKQRDLAELWHWRSRTRQLMERGEIPKVIPGSGGKTIDEIIQMVAAKAAEEGAFPAAIDDDFPAFNKPYREAADEEFLRLTSIAMERHRAFNWLCGYAPGNRWAETPTDT